MLNILTSLRIKSNSLIEDELADLLEAEYCDDCQTHVQDCECDWYYNNKNSIDWNDIDTDLGDF